MLLYRLASCKFIDDLSGQGAYLFGGRWNSKGKRMLYTSSSLSLALLENLVHLDHLGGIVPLCFICLDVSACTIKELDPKELPKNWRKFPAPLKLSELGDKFIDEGAFTILKVPSAVNNSEFNYLVNTAHPLAPKIKIIQRGPFKIDSRLLD